VNQLRFANLMARVLNVPLLAHPTKALIFYNALAGRFGTAPLVIGPDALPDYPQVSALRRGEREITPEIANLEPAPRTFVRSERLAPGASRFVGSWPKSEDDSGRVEPFRLTREGVGVITVTGSLVNRGAWVGSYSGETSYEGIKYQIARAGNDSRVKSVILDMETPGGEAVGAFETAAAVRAVAENKPVVAVVNGMAASAGYAIASGASSIVASQTGITGSIGVVMLHLDYSAALEKEGIAPTLIFAGARKVDGNPFESLTDAVKEDLQAEVTQFYDLFVETVAQGRGRRTPAKVARETEARTYIGRQAVDARLADDTGSFEDVLSELTRRSQRASGGSGKRSAKMELNLDEAQIAEAQLEAARQQGHAAGLQEGRSAGAQAERERLLAVLNHADTAGRERFAIQLALEAPAMTADGVVRMCQQVPKASGAAPAVPSVATRERETGADQITGTAGRGPDGGNAPAGASSWDSSVDQTNRRTNQLNPRAAHLLRN